MLELKELITRAKQKDVKAMEELFNQFKPLLKSRAKRYSRIGLEYDDVFQQAALLFIIGVYEHQVEKERSPTAFSSYIKKRLDWGLWMYYRKFLRQETEISSGLKPKKYRTDQPVHANVGARCIVPRVNKRR
jgi:DNA-directed RNA polymerase specialized sigma subunit